MALAAAKCPSCGGNLEAPEDQDVVKCTYCRTDVIVREAIAVTIGNKNNFITLAQAAAEAGNHQEAYDYYNKVLEIEPNNYEAWQGKGISAGWQSSLKKSRLSEMLICIRKSIALADNESLKEVVQMQSAAEVVQIAQAYFDLSTEHTMQFIAVPEAKYEHFDRCREIVNVCEQAKLLDADLPESNRLIIDISKRLLGVSGISNDDRNFFTDALSRNGGSATSQNTSSNSGCFVITATMGNENHIAVKILRDFRSEILANFHLGREFIHWYYNKGPEIAGRIAGSNSLRVISLFFLVIPSSLIASGVLVAKRVWQRIA